MKHFFLFGLTIILILVLTGCKGNADSDTLKTEEAQNGKEEAPVQVVRIEQEGVSFQFDPSLAGMVDCILIPASDEDSMLPYPTYLQFTLNNPDNAGDIFLNGYLKVFSVEQYRQIDSVAGDMIDSLAEMLATGIIETADFELPYLPYVNAGQLFHSNIQIVSFENGEGIRYLTQHAQDVTPILNEGLFYSFQGLTTDKLFYVSFSFPVNHPALANTWDDYFADLDYQVFSDNFQTYLEKDWEVLNNSPDSNFNPPLRILDQLVESIMVNDPSVLIEETDSVG